MLAMQVSTGLPVCCPAGSCPEPTALPGIVVQGATLEAPQPPAASAPAPSPGPAAAAPGDAAASDGAQGTIAGVPGYTVGNAVTVVTGEELRAQQVRHAAEALRSLPGVSVSRSGGFGNLTQVRIRGAEGNHTLVLIDGIEANNTADGEFDFSNLSAEDIERIEVIRGPMSGLYGSNAVGGVINIITRRGQGPLHRVGAHGGRLVRHPRRRRARVRRQRQGAYLARPTIGATPTASTSRPVGDERDGSRIGTFTVRGGATLLPGVTLDFTRAPHREESPIATASAGPAGTLATAIDDRSTLNHKVFLAGANLRWDMLGGRARRRSSAPTTTAPSPPIPIARLFPRNSRNISEAEKLAYLASYRLDMPAIARTKHASPAASRRSSSASRPKAPSPTGWSASAAASPTRASGAAASPTGCSSRPASATTTTTTSRTSRPGAPPPRWCCRSSACGRMPASARPSSCPPCSSSSAPARSSCRTPA